MSNDATPAYSSFEDLAQRHSSMARAPRPCALGDYKECDVEITPGVNGVKHGSNWYCSDEHAALDLGEPLS